MSAHLRQATRLRRRFERLEDEQAAARGLLERLSIAAVLVDELGEPTYLNAVARRLRSRGDISVGGAGERPAGRMGPPHDTHADADRANGGGTKAREPHVRDRSGHFPDNALIIPAPGKDVSAAAAVVLPGGGEEPKPSVEGLGRFLHLTLAEARVAAGLVTGRSINQIAIGLQVSRNTVRWHVGHVLDKVGVRTQGQFIQLVLRGPACLADGSESEPAPGGRTAPWSSPRSN